MCGRIQKVGVVMRGDKLLEDYGPCGRELTIKAVLPKEEESLRVKREWWPQYDQVSSKPDNLCPEGKRLCINQKRDLNKLWNTSAPRRYTVGFL